MIPESLFRVSSLEYVYLNNNNFSGSISDNVGDLNRVLELWLYGNRLSGSIPDSIGKCSKLQTLYLNENLLEGSLPNSVTELKSLVYLYLHHNNFHGRIPFGFGNCKNLSVLDLSFNGFNGGIPSDLGNSSSLTEIVIVDSNLTGIIPSSLGLLTQLSALDLSENRFSGRIPPELGKCRSLTSLKLYRNQLEGEIPGELGMLTKLQDLELFTNHLRGEIPISIWKIPSLEYLLVYNNSLSGELPQEMTELKQLKNVSLFDNRFSGVIPQGLGINSSLLQLDFTNNKFTGEIPPNLCSGKQLRVLNMGHNRLGGSIPSDVGQCPALWRLIFKGNNLTGPLPEFAETPRLEHIDISENTISGSLPRSLGNSTSLTYIDFSMNKFSGFIPPELGKLVKLEFFDLSHNQLKGPLPSQLSNCFKLGYFDVGFNSLNGSIPSSLKNWTKLYTLSLQENRFTGGIPAFLSEFEMLTELQMGGNLLRGEIPSSIGSLQSLQYALNLSSNQLTGEIPSSLGDLIKLEQLDISNNNLTGSLATLNRIRTLFLINISQNHFTGPIPGEMMNLLKSSPSSFFGNPGLCVECTLKCTENEHFKSCASQFGPRKGLGRVDIAMIALVSVVAVFILVFACVFAFHQRQKKDTEIASAEEGPASLLSKVMEATENLNDSYIIGRGCHGTVYKAALNEDGLFAVKRIAFSDHKGGNKSMIREIKTIGKIRHRNLIRLEQFWLRKDYGLILYTYMENGSLHDVLHGFVQSAGLEWNVRYRIAIGTANALAYLHYDCDPPVVHRDIKPENILLDSDMEPHISDFGIAKLLEHQCSASENSTVVMGTTGYIAPENAFTSTKSKESDVYSYGVVLLEVITRKKALDSSFPDGIDIVEWCRSVWFNRQDICDIVDPGLAEEFYDYNTMVHVSNVFLLALRCTQTEPSRRPTMRDVVKQLLSQNEATNKPLRVCSTS
ncbi:receptor-like protein kinase isoform X2 [Euphorbia lathyris]